VLSTVIRHVYISDTLEIARASKVPRRNTTAIAPAAELNVATVVPQSVDTKAHLGGGGRVWFVRLGLVMVVALGVLLDVS
jgi:hypothetical protein